MIKIQLASDLHLEFLQRGYPGERLIAPVSGADVLVLAGDIANGVDAFKLFADWSGPSNSIPVIYVAGNHEFYGHAIEPMRLKMKEAAAHHNIHFLENESVVLNGVRFLGTTLWTDYRLDPYRSQAQQMQHLEYGLNDHQLIRSGGKRFTTQDALRCHQQARDWLQQELAQPWAGKTVVVSHHAPHPGSVHPRYQDNILNPGFASDLSDLLPGVDLFLHGHAHDGFDYQVGRCRVVANPAGYILNRGYAPREQFEFENKAFNPALTLELPS
jgi:3',5'-cyclic AMP phosphodiesterase CpdA